MNDSFSIPDTLPVGIEDDGFSYVSIEDNSLSISIEETGLSIGIINTGTQGPPGPVGGNAIMGYTIVQDKPLSSGDVLAFNASTSSWNNLRQFELVDGGNF